MQWAARSSGLVILNEPRNDLANGVRELVISTASLICDVGGRTLTAPGAYRYSKSTLKSNVQALLPRLRCLKGARASRTTFKGLGPVTNRRYSRLSIGATLDPPAL